MAAYRATDISWNLAAQGPVRFSDLILDGFWDPAWRCYHCHLPAAHFVDYNGTYNSDNNPNRFVDWFQCEARCHASDTKTLSRSDYNKPKTIELRVIVR